MTQWSAMVFLFCHCCRSWSLRAAPITVIHLMGAKEVNTCWFDWNFCQLYLLQVLIQLAPLCIYQIKKSIWCPVLLWSWPIRSNWFRRVQVLGLGLDHVAARRTLLPCGSGWSGWRGRCRLSGRNAEDLREAAAPPRRAKVKTCCCFKTPERTWKGLGKLNC